MTLIKKMMFLSLVGVLFASCNAYKDGLVQKGGSQKAISNAILDFSNTSNLYARDSVFEVRVYDPFYESLLVSDSITEDYTWVKGKQYEGIIAVRIVPTYFKHLVRGKKDSSSSDLNFYEKDGKLFYWDKPEGKLNDKTIAILRKYNLIVETDDEFLVSMETEMDKLKRHKEVHYFFCSNNLRNYKRVKPKTNDPRHYDPPLPNCSQ